MTVRELKQALKGLPDYMDVYIKQTNDEYSISYVETAKVVEATFVEDTGEDKAKDDVFLITDDDFYL